MTCKTVARSLADHLCRPAPIGLEGGGILQDAVRGASFFLTYYHPYICSPLCLFGLAFLESMHVNRVDVPRANFMLPNLSISTLSALGSDWELFLEIAGILLQDRH
jgi:hypothetical protein